MLAIVCLVLLLLAAAAAAATPGGNAAAELALLSFKSTLSDPAGLLSSWNASTPLCAWQGVQCGRRHPERVVVLDLSSSRLAGRLSPSLGNLTHLRALDLSANSLHGGIPAALGNCGELREINLTNNQLRGEIPPEIGSLRKLAVLDLSSNGLSGVIPPPFANLSSIATLRLSSNTLSGEIPAALGNLSALQVLGLSINALSGSIPSSLGHLSSLVILRMFENGLSGGIPASLGRLPLLSVLGLDSNNFSGTIPPSIWNVSSLTGLFVGLNNLSGMIPQDALAALPWLQRLHLYQNQFHGPLPASLANASNLWDVELQANAFVGRIPPVFGRMKGLQTLLLASNLLETPQPEDWEFMTGLTNCTYLKYLELDTNNFSGELPGSVSNLSSTSLKSLMLGATNISGSIPAGIGNIVSLESLNLADCMFTGSLPPSLGTLRSLQRWTVSNNHLSGHIPWTIGNLTTMLLMDLSSNGFNGTVPASIGSMSSLLLLNLSRNQLTGTIPKELVSISTLSMKFDLSHNFLEGPIPLEVGNLQNLVEFHAESNRLHGEIPASFAGCLLLQKLYLQNNSLGGDIPPALSRLKALQILDLSDNELSGQVPLVGAFANASAISVQGNDELCGGIQELHLPPCSVLSPKNKHKFPVKIVVITTVAIWCLLLLLSFLFLALYKKRSAKRVSTASSLRGQGHALISYSELVKATDGFSTTNLVGAGSFGSVYKGKLGGEGDGNASLVAVKVLNLHTRGALRSFSAECEAMRNLRHRNLIKIITVCSSIDFAGNDFKAIVLEFMPNGSLEDWLHPRGQSAAGSEYLDLLQRVNIAFDVACALEYLHHHGAAPVVHCDLKPSNVLLDEDMVAHVGDFGIAKVLAEDISLDFQNATSSSCFKGTVGYAPPEYGAGNAVSTHGDIYSFGVLLLEIITGKRPTSSNIFKEEQSLPEYVQMALPDNTMDVVDSAIVSELEGTDEEALDEATTAHYSSRERKIACVTSLLRLGLLCCKELPVHRMSIEDVVKEVHGIKDVLNGRRNVKMQDMPSTSRQHEF